MLDGCAGGGSGSEPSGFTGAEPSGTIVGDCEGGGGDGAGSLFSGWPGAACEIGCDGGVDDDTKHADVATEIVVTNGVANDRRGTRAGI
jgi:hypothetical protein